MAAAIDLPPEQLQKNAFQNQFIEQHSGISDRSNSDSAEECGRAIPF